MKIDSTHHNALGRAMLYTEAQKIKEVSDWIYKAQALLRGLGACPDCLTVPKMDGDGPFSSCRCGTGEDYGIRICQIAQLQFGTDFTEVEEEAHKVLDIRVSNDYRHADDLVNDHLALIDFSEIENRVLASMHISPEVLNGQGEDKFTLADRFTLAASEKYGVPPERVTSEQRKTIKLDVFSMLYGSRATGDKDL